MAIDERDGAASEPAGTHGERLPDASGAGLPGTGLVKGLAVTLKHHAEAGDHPAVPARQARPAGTDARASSR